MTIERAKRLAEQLASGGVCSLREGEAEEYHKMFLTGGEMMDEYISKETMRGIIREQEAKHGLMGCAWIEMAMDRQPAADVVSMEEYSRLRQIAKNMHLWIFLHTDDEQAAYDDIGLTDEENAVFGYEGRFVLEERKEGAD